MVMLEASDFIQSVIQLRTIHCMQFVIILFEVSILDFIFYKRIL